MITETEFFHEIFEEFLGLDNEIYEDEFWKSKSIIKLMHISGEIEDKQIIEEGLKIILSLCKFKECGNLIDSYESESYSAKDLIKPEKEILNTILIAEFT